MKISRADEFCKEFFREYHNSSMMPGHFANQFGFRRELAIELIEHGRFLHDLEAVTDLDHVTKIDFGLIDDNTKAGE